LPGKSKISSVFKILPLVLALLIMAPLLAYTNCSSAEHDPSGLDQSSIDTATVLKTLRQETNSIFNNKCSSCHNAQTTDNNLKNLFDLSYLVNNNFIHLGLPQTSPLYLQLVDGIMPPTGSTDITNYEMTVIRDWIAAEGGIFQTYIGGTPIDGSGDNGFSAVRILLNQNCVNCHKSGGEPPRLDVDAATLRGSVFQGRPLVVPGNAAASVLFQSLGGMPTGNPMGMNSADGIIFRNWINSGAN